MEYTITLPDSPPMIARGSDGASLNLFGEPESEPPVAPQPLMEAQACHYTQRTEGETPACPHRQTCYQIFSEWCIRRGKYQRPDVTSYDRLSIAQRYYDPDRPWGEVIGMAQEHNLSRRAIYDIVKRVSVLFEPRAPGPAPCLKRLLPCGAKTPQVEVEAETPSREEEERMRSRLILTSVFPGGVTMRPLEDIADKQHPLEEAPLVKGRSASTIWRFVDEAGSKAHQILSQVDYGDISLPIIWIEIDETFFNGRPILFAVEPLSLSICGFHVPADGDRSSYTWGPLLLILQEDQHLNIFGGVGDAAKPYPCTFEALLERGDRFQEDTFHQLRALQTLRCKLENKAYRAFATEYKTAGEWEEEGATEAREKLHQAEAESLRLAELHDSFAEYSSWVADAFQIVDLRSGEIRGREINEWLLDEAITRMSQLDSPEVIKMSERLHNHKERLLVYLDWLGEQMPPLRAGLHTYLDDPELEKVVLRAVARHWRLQHEVESMQRRAFRPSLKRAEQELATWIEGDVYLEQLSQQVHTLLELVQRASSAVENINSIFKPLITRKKHFDSVDTNLNFVALFVLWHDLRVFKEGKRQGYSPFDILGIDLGERDWRTLLGYPAVQ